MFGRFRRLLATARICLALALCAAPGSAAAGPLLGGGGQQQNSILNNTTNQIGNTLGNVGNTVGGTTSQVGSTLNSATGQVGGTLNSMTGQVGGTLNSATGQVGGTLNSTLPGPIGNTLNSVTTGAGDTLNTLTTGVGDTLNTVTNGVGDTLETVTGGVGDTVEGVTGGVGDTLQGVTNGVGGTLDQVLGRDAAGRPVVAGAIERDAQGDRVVAGKVLAIAPTDRALSAARALDFQIESEEQLSPLGLKLVVLRAPPGMRTIEAVRRLRAADPQGAYDFAHIYDPVGQAAVGPGEKRAEILEARDAKIGIIDAGIDKTHPAFANADIATKVTVKDPGMALPTAHGTAVASLLVGEDRMFQGVLPGAELYAADAFAGSATGGAADDIVRALAWLADKSVPVVNISITGPKNALLEAAVRAMIARGHIIVAAAGNDGPAAPVKYPAAYSGVIAVTSVDAKDKVQLDANRGKEIAFAARGVDVRVAQPGSRYGAATGTSFASPLVAARFAELMSGPDVGKAERAQRALISEAKSPTGARDAVYGFGILEPRSTSAAETAAK